MARLALISIDGKSAEDITPDVKAFVDKKFKTKDGKVYSVGHKAGDIAHGLSTFGENFMGLKTIKLTYQEQMEKDFGRKAKEGYHFVRNNQSLGVVELRDGTPACCDPSTETYHCM